MARVDEMGVEKFEIKAILAHLQAIISSDRTADRCLNGVHVRLPW